MDINQLVLSDAALSVIEDGAWVGEFPDAPGVRVKVIGLSSKSARKSIESKQALMRKKGRGEALTTEQLAESVRETLGEVVLQDWEGLTDDGAIITFSRDLAKKWLSSRNGEKFASIVLRAAQQIDERSHDFVAKVVKN